MVAHVDALDLIRLGRQLVRTEGHALRGSMGTSLPTGPSPLLRDVFANPGASIKVIAERTALPQSYVSESVAKLREKGLVSTEVDAADRRRTLVRVRPEHELGVARKGGRPIDRALTEALDGADSEVVRTTVEALSLVASRLSPRALGPIMEQLRSDQSGARTLPGSSDA